jgi:hypothetical protein
MLPLDPLLEQGIDVLNGQRFARRKALKCCA